jgi:Arc/MetJ-type ribon-helix-helix transcriptional regulator
MAYQFPPDVEKLVKEQMVLGSYRSEDELLRDALRALEEQRQMVVYDDPEVLAGIGRGLDEMNRGLGRPFEELDAGTGSRNRADRRIG